MTRWTLGSTCLHVQHTLNAVAGPGEPNPWCSKVRLFLTLYDMLARPARFRGDYALATPGD
jgi:hypothetical protein